MTLPEIKRECMRKNIQAMYGTKTEIDSMMKIVIETYYTGDPSQYIRTDMLKTAPKTEGVNGGGMSCSMKAFLNEGYYTYPHGRYNSGAQVIEATNEGMRNVVGTPGYWERMESYMKVITDAHYSAMFG